MEKRMIRFAVIGCGRMGVQADDTAAQWATAPLWIPLSHASAIQATENAKLAAFCDVDLAKARAAAHRFGVDASFSNLDEMLATIRPDAVTIATRTSQRREIIEECIDFGIKGIYCEKPLCFSLEDADATHRKIVENGVHFIFGTRRRYMPVYQRAREAFWKGEIGEPQNALFSFGYAPLLWTHPHVLDLASFFAQDAEIISVEADLDYAPEARQGLTLDADPCVRDATIRFANGITAHVTRSGGFDVDLCGTEGKISVCSDGLRTLRRSTSVNKDIVDAGMFLASADLPTPVEVSGTVNSLRILVAALSGRSVELPDSSLAQRNMELILGLVESGLAGGRRVEWPLKRRGLTVTGRIGNLYP